MRRVKLFLSVMHVGASEQSSAAYGIVQVTAGWKPTVRCLHHWSLDNALLAQVLDFTSVTRCFSLKRSLDGIACCVGGCHAYIEGHAASWDSSGSGKVCRICESLWFRRCCRVCNLETPSSASKQAQCPLVASARPFSHERPDERATCERHTCGNKSPTLVIYQHAPLRCQVLLGRGSFFESCRGDAGAAAGVEER